MLATGRDLNHCHRFVLFVWLVVVCGGQSSLASQADRDFCSDVADIKNTLSPLELKREIDLGKRLTRQMERSAKLLSDPAAIQYVNRLAQNLARHSDGPYPVTVKILDSAAENEMIMLGGSIYLDRGLILQAKTEAELAGVLAYGIAYPLVRSANREAVGPEMTLASIPATLFSDGMNWAVLFAALNVAMPFSYLQQERISVLRADCLGLNYVHASGYDVESSVELLHRISLNTSFARKQNVAFDQFPAMETRLRLMRRHVATLVPSPGEAIVSTSDFDQTRSALASRPETTTDFAKPTLKK